MLAFSSHEKLATHTCRPSHTYMRACTHIHVHTYTHTWTLTQNWANSVEGGPERVLSWTMSVYNSRRTWPAAAAHFPTPRSLPRFWNEPCISELLPICEGGKTSAQQLDLAS